MNYELNDQGASEKFLVLIMHARMLIDSVRR